MSNSASFTTPDLCDDFPHDIVVAEPIFKNFGGISSFYGSIVTVKCFEDNSLVKEQVSRPGNGRVLVGRWWWIKTMRLVRRSSCRKSQ